MSNHIVAFLLTFFLGCVGQIAYAGREEAIDALSRRLEHGLTVALLVGAVMGIYYFFKK